MTPTSLTNTTLLELLTPERQDELLHLLLQGRMFYAVVQESRDYNGILDIYISFDQACERCISILEDMGAEYNKEDVYEYLGQGKGLQVGDFGVLRKEIHIFKFPCNKQSSSNSSSSSKIENK